MIQLPLITTIYFDPTTDFGFKKLFGEEANKDLLLDFLNSMLPKSHQIVSLEFQKTEQLPDHQDDRKAIFDIVCQDVNGETFVVEMQKARLQFMIDRSLYYSTFPIQKQAPKGIWNFNLSRVYLISILDFDYDKDLNHWKKRQLLRSATLKDDRGVTITDKLHFKFLQLPFFTKTEKQLKTHFDKWCYFLKNLETLDHIPQILNEPVFMKAFEVAEVANLNMVDYVLYQISKSKKYDWELYKMETREELAKEITKEVTELVTEKVTSEVTEKVTSEVTEKVTSEVTEKVTSEVSQQVTEKKDIEFILILHNLRKEPEEISLLTGLPMAYVVEIIQKQL
jgi:predicted transposase/invertase (TIGR01784 family)